MNNTPTPSHRICFIGTRGHYGNVLREMEAVPRVVPVGACAGGDSADALDRWAREHAVALDRFDDVDAMLDATNPSIAVVCGPFERHAAHTLAAVRRGVNVIAEKPVALTDDELRTLEAACADAPGVQLAGMMFSRFDSAFFHGWQLTRGGAIGEVRLINARKSYKLGRRGTFYADRATYGGTIPWVGSHAIDWMMWYANAVPRRVYATHSSCHNGGNGSMEASASCLFEFANEVSATVSIDVLRPEAAPTHGDDWIRMVGTKGTLEVREGVIQLIDSAGPRIVTPPKPPRTFLQAFLDQVDGAAEPIIDARQTFDLTRTLLAARRAADERRPIEIGA